MFYLENIYTPGKHKFRHILIILDVNRSNSPEIQFWSNYVKRENPMYTVND